MFTKFFSPNNDEITENIAKLSHQDAQVRFHAAAALRDLSSCAETNSDTIRDDVRKAQGIAPLVALLKDADRIVKFYATEALWNLAKHHTVNQAAILDCDALPLLSNLASTDDNARQTLEVCQAMLTNRENSQKKSNEIQTPSSTQSTSSPNSKISTSSNESETVEALRRQLAGQQKQLEKAQADARIAKSDPHMEKGGLSDSAPSAVPTINSSALQVDRNKKLGEGGFGMVYKGTWQMVTVAVKQLHATRLSAEALASFQEEAQRHGLLRHPYVVMLFGVCIDPQRYSMVMEFMAGGSLYDLLHNTQDILWSVRLSMARNIATGLYYLHANSIVHRDLKSPNVLLDGHGQAKLADFGLATVKSETLSTTTNNTQAPGTTRWMAPELFKRGAKCTPSTDIYALGWVLWELSSRKIPFQDEKHASNAVIMQWIKDEEREEIPTTTPPKYAALLSECWQQRSEARPASVKAIAERLNVIEDADASLSSGYRFVSK